MILALVRSILRHRLAWLLLLLATMAGSLYLARRVSVHFQYRDFYTYPGNQRLEVFKRYSADFRDPGGYVAVLLEAPDVFAPPVLGYIDALSRALQARPELSDVKSLTTVQLVRAEGDEVATGLLIERLPRTPAEVERLRRAALASGLLRRVLVAPDGRATAVLAEMRSPATTATIEEQEQALRAVRGALAAHPAPPGVTVAVTGQPLVEAEVTRTLVRDLLTLTPLTMLVLTLALVLVFRSLQGVVLVLSTVSVALVWTAGIFAALGRPVDIVGSIIPTVLLVYGAVDPIFILTRYLRKLESGLDRRAAILAAMSEMGQPCFVTSVTTALGFAAFATAVLPTVRHFGLILAVGVMLAFVTTLVVLPLLLSVAPPPRRRLDQGGLALALDRLLVRLWRAVNRRRLPVLALAGLSLVLGAVAGRGLQINNQYVGSLPAGPALSATRTLEERLSGVVRIAVYFEGPREAMKRPQVLTAMARTAETIRGQEIVNVSMSVADLVAEINQAFAGGAPAERKVPASSRLIGQYLTLVDPRDRDEFVSGDYSRAHLLVVVADRGSAPVRRLIALLEQELQRQGFAALGIRTTLTAMGYMGYQEVDGIVVEVLWGFVVAFSIAVLLQWILFRSLRLALVSIVPNLVPVGACFLAIAALGLDLRVDNALFLCVSVGGLFNTTIHIVARVLQEVRAGRSDRDQIVEEALRTVGPASLYTAVILSAGFAVISTSGFPGLRQLGWLSMVTLLVGAAADMVFTPLLVRLVRSWPAPERPRDLPPLTAAPVHPGR